MCVREREYVCEKGRESEWVCERVSDTCVCEREREKAKREMKIAIFVRTGFLDKL